MPSRTEAWPCLDRVIPSLNPFDYYLPLKRVKDHLTECLVEDTSLQAAARIAHMETNYFSKYFHRKVGTTFTSWLRGERIAKAMEMMNSSDHSIAEVAFAVGFGDLRTFQRAFKEITSITPKAYRRKVREQICLEPSVRPAKRARNAAE